LAQELHIERKVVAFHLAELDKVSLVKGRYALNQDKRPVAVKYYELTARVKKSMNTSPRVSWRSKHWILSDEPI